ncbi:Cytochrome p450 [Thalictrum thalictroides]|uniref:Cytochrome p450 n=1 Tax=Thalictrum thalictroides TaxID=46969 RepID=A0A7J6X0G9_THATH|nr:Cytochrome p450 [Thalictrum thalictroides]
MEVVQLGLLVVFSVIVASWAFKMVNWIWLKPMRMKKYLKKQGIGGPSYKLFDGNLKEIVKMKIEATSKPMELSHRIVPRLLPFQYQAVQTYGKMFVSWIGPIPRVNIMEPEMIRDILSNKFGHFAKVRVNPLVGMLAKGVVSYQGEKWVKHRRIINPAFHQEKLKLMLPAFYACCSELVEKWEKLLLSKESCEVDVWPYLQNLTADVISRTAFGSSYEEGRRIFELQTEQAMLVMEASRSIYIPGFRFADLVK